MEGAIHEPNDVDHQQQELLSKRAARLVAGALRWLEFEEILVLPMMPTRARNVAVAFDPGLSHPRRNQGVRSPSI
jgi:hypothetical protein